MATSIQGYSGSFHHQVATELNVDDDLLMRDDFSQVFEDMISRRANLAVVAIENSIAGAILENYDLLKKSRLRVLGEYYLPIKMNLIGLPNQKLSDITEVRSHPMALKQCQQFLSQHPHIRQIAHADTALAIKEIVQKKLDGVAGIGGEFAAATHGAEIIVGGIETHKYNYTRFLIIGGYDNAKLPQLEYDNNGLTKSSLYLETNHEPGALQKVLQLFDGAGYNLTMLVSRPILGEGWHYGFYIDFEHKFSISSDIQQDLKPLTKKLLVFGSYPSFIQPLPN